MSESVLIIEDELDAAIRLAKFLEAEGYKVSIETNGESGLRAAQEKIPTLIILDIMLPDLDGLSLCRIIRSNRATQPIPIIMLTARGMEVDKIVGLESGADDYLVKPVKLGEFLARVRAVIRRSRPPVGSGDKFESLDLKMDLVSRKTYKAGEELRLTNKEFDLLALFMRNKGVVLSRDLILTQVWGYDAFVDKRTVDVHVRWLREKIEIDASDPRRLTTVRGVGYRFEG